MLLPFHCQVALCIALLVCSASVTHSQDERLNDWIGKYPVAVKSNPRRSIYNSPALRPRLLKLLGAKYYRRLADGYYVMSEIENIDGYLIAEMCEQHNCPASNSFMAVDLRAGDIHVAFYSLGCVEWFHTKGKANDLPHNVLHKPWWMQGPGIVTKVTETTRRAT
jgi:hypothetical protein